MRREKPVAGASPEGVRPLTELPSGTTARVVFVTPGAEQRLRRLETMGLVTGAALTLLQKRPTLVVEMEGTTLALEGEVGRLIYVRAEAQA